MLRTILLLLLLLYIDKKSGSAKEKRNCSLFYVFLFFFPDCYDGLQTQIDLYAENIFFSFYAKSFSGAFTNEFLPGISPPGTKVYHNTCFLVCHSFLLTIAIRTSFFLSDWQLLLLPSNSNMKYI